MLALLHRDLLLAARRPADALGPLVFFALVACLFPLAIGPKWTVGGLSSGSLPRCWVSCRVMCPRPVSVSSSVPSRSRPVFQSRAIALG